VEASLSAIQEMAYLSWFQYVSGFFLHKGRVGTIRAVGVDGAAQVIVWEVNGLTLTLPDRRARCIMVVQATDLFADAMVGMDSPIYGIGGWRLPSCVAIHVITTTRVHMVHDSDVPLVMGQVTLTLTRTLTLTLTLTQVIVSRGLVGEIRQVTGQGVWVAQFVEVEIMDAEVGLAVPHHTPNHSYT
jgi:hypothetical protein